MVVTRNGQTAVQALYRMRTARQRLEVRLPAGAKLDSTPLRINGRPVALERGLATADQTAAAEGSAGGEAGQGSLNSSYYIPLAGRDTLEDVIVELRYTVDSDQRELELPEFPEEPATQQLHLCVFLPRELALVRSLGPWSDELENKWQTALWDRFAVRISDEELIENLVEGIDYAGDTSFATEGVLHVFSTLQPPAGAAGALRLIAVSTRSLNLMLFGAIGLLGLVLLARPVSHKLAALALVVVAIVLSGVFLPIFSRQLLDANLALALGLMAFVWTVWHVAQLLKRHALAQPPRPREVEEPPAAAGTANGDAGGGRLKHVKMAVGAWSGGGPPEAATAPGDTGGPGGPDDPPAGKLPPSGASPPSAADRQADQAGEGNPDDDQLSGGGRHA